MLKSKLTLEIATIENLSWIMQAIDLCRPVLAMHQSGQWQGKEPSKETIEIDIKNKQFYLLFEDHQCLGGAALLNKDNAYDHLLAGSWLNQEPYVVVHRFFIHPTFHGNHLGRELLKSIESHVWHQGVRNIRLDTHERNIPMRKLLTSQSYQEVGRVNLPQAGERLVYHKVRGNSL